MSMGTRLVHAVMLGSLVAACTFYRTATVEVRWPLTSGAGLSEMEHLGDGVFSGVFQAGYCPRYEPPGSFGHDGLAYNGNTSIADFPIPFEGLLDDYTFTMWLRADQSMRLAEDYAVVFHYKATSKGYINRASLRFVAGGQLQFTVHEHRTVVLASVTTPWPWSIGKPVLVVASVVQNPPTIMLSVGGQDVASAPIPKYSPLTVPGLVRIGGPKTFQFGTLGLYCFTGTISCFAVIDKAIGAGLTYDHSTCHYTTTGPTPDCHDTPTDRDCLPAPTTTTLPPTTTTLPPTTTTLPPTTTTLPPTTTTLPPTTTTLSPTTTTLPPTTTTLSPTTSTLPPTTTTLPPTTSTLPPTTSTLPPTTTTLPPTTTTLPPTTTTLPPTTSTLSPTTTTLPPTTPILPPTASSELHFWPLDDVAKGNDVTTTSSSLTSPQTQACFRTAEPTVVPGSVQTRTFLHFDGSPTSRLSMALDSSAVNRAVGRVAVWLRLKGPGEGVLWDYETDSPPTGGGVRAADARVLAGGVLRVRLWDSTSSSSPCGSVDFSVADHPGDFVLVVFERRAGNLTLTAGDGAVAMATHSCLVHTGEERTTPGTLAVGRGYLGDLACLTFTSGDLDPLNITELSNFCPEHSYVDTSGAVCEVTARWTLFRPWLLSGDSVPTLAAVGSNPARSLVSCARLCMETPYCRSFTFGPGQSCRLYDFVTARYFVYAPGTSYYLPWNYG